MNASTADFRPPWWLEGNVVEISRHTGMDFRYPDCMDAPKPDHPWSLGSGGPPAIPDRGRLCRNDGENLIQQHCGL